MRIAIVGFGEQGRSAYEYWNQPGNEITVCEQNEAIELPSNAKKKLGPDHLKNLAEFDLIVRSPIVHPQALAEANSPAILSKVTSVTNEFMRVVPTKKIIGVTGTKGKGTTSTLVAKILEASGQRVHLGGNIGTPPLDMLRANIEPNDYVVLELANFQLIDIKYSPHIAVCLMISADHIDWHRDMAEYLSAKANLFNHQTAQDVAIYFAPDENSKKIVAGSPGKKIPYFASPGAYVRDDGMIILGDTPIIHKTEVKLIGEHNLQNICAAVTAVSEAVGSLDKVRAVLSSFSGLEHRLELVRSLDDVKYYDDSFATTPDAAIVALRAFKEPKVVILGGSDKGLPFEPLADEVVKSDVRHAIIIGATADKIGELLRERGFSQITLGLEKMPDIVAAARKQARRGDVVLLSTGCASFGLFKDYKDRGNQFKEVVNSL